MREDAVGFILGYILLWALALLWSFVTSRRKYRGGIYEKLWESGTAVLSFAAGGAAVGFVAVGLDADIGVGIILVLAAGVAAAILPALALGGAFDTGGAGRYGVQETTGIQKPGRLLRKSEKEQSRIIKQTNTPQLLLQALVYSPYPTVRKSALEKLDDDRLLHKTIMSMGSLLISRGGKDEGEGVLARRAAEKINDQNILAEIACSYSINLPSEVGSDIQMRATENITDENLLREIAVKSPDIYAQKTALDKLSDQAVFEALGRNTHDSFISCEAVKRILNEDVLAEIAQKGVDNPPYCPRLTAVQRITSSVHLKHLAENAGSYPVREAARERLANAGKIATKKARDITAGKLPLDEAGYIALATTSPEPSVRVAALRKIQNVAAVREILANEKDAGVLKEMCGSAALEHRPNGCRCARCGKETHDYVYDHAGSDRVSPKLTVSFDLYTCARCGKTERRNVTRKKD